MKESFMRILTVMMASVLFAALPMIGMASASAETAEEQEGNPFSDFNIQKGAYTMDVILGNAPEGVSVKSPAVITIVNYEGTAEVIWNGEYDSMTVDGETLKPTATGQETTFLMPLKILDGRIPVTVHSEEKGDIECTLRFSGNSYKPYDKYRSVTNVVYPAILLVLIFLGYYGRVRKKNSYKARTTTGISRGRNKK